MCSVMLDYVLIFSWYLIEVPCGATSSKAVLHLFLPAVHTCQLLEITCYVKITVWRNILVPSKLPCDLSVPSGIFFSNSHFTQSAGLWGSGSCKGLCFDFPPVLLQYLVSCAHLGIKIKAN